MDEKYDKITKIRGAIASVRKDIGQYGDSAKISWLRSYLNGLGTDADLLREFMSHLHADEEAALQERYAHEMERTDLVLADTVTLNTLPDLPNAPSSAQPAVSAADIHNIVHTAVQTAVNGQKPEKKYSEEDNPLLGVAIGEFLNGKSSGTAKSSQNWYRSKCENFKNVLTALHDGSEPRIAEITVDMVRTYKKVLHRFPRGGICPLPRPPASPAPRPCWR